MNGTYSRSPGERPAGNGSERAPRRVRRLRHELWLHPEVSDDLREWPHLYQRLGLVLRQLAASGQTSVVKSCRSANRGWLRTPLGGHGGRQYYLWWAYAGSPKTRGLDVPKGTVIVRAARHHDDHGQLDPGTAGEYLRLERSEDLGSDMAGEPWTDAQQKFASARSDVRLLIGRPGSGKTTALWNAVESEPGERVLYLTWSTALGLAAKAHFESFAGDGVSVECLSFSAFVGEIVGRDVEQQTLARSQSLLDQAVTRAGRNMAGIWANHLSELHSEMRAHLIGRAWPAQAGSERSGGVYRLTDETYKGARTSHTIAHQKAVRSVLKVARSFPGDCLRKVYPELGAAQEAVETLRAGKMPERFLGVDRIVIDEAQDLTMVELHLVTVLCRALQGRTGRRPMLLVAGDAGQTVRPTGFTWKTTAALLSEEMGPTQSFHLDEHVRCPKRIAEIIERSALLYGDIDKELRPDKQHRQRGGEHVEANVMHVRMESPEEAARLCRAVRDSTRAVMITPTDAIPEWVPEDCRASVLRPARAKGLEYQSVCVLDGGRAVRGLRASLLRDDAERLQQEAARTDIDALRVALSRATEGLALADLRPDADATEAAGELLGPGIAPGTADDLIERLEEGDVPAEDKVRSLVAEAQGLIDSAPERAWQRALQAVHMLGRGDRPNGVADPKVRDTARATVLGTAGRLLMLQDTGGVKRAEIQAGAVLATEVVTKRDDIKGVTDEDMHHVMRSTEVNTLIALEEWTEGLTNSPRRLLGTISLLKILILEDELDWTTGIVPGIAQSLREGLRKGADDPAEAANYEYPVIREWLQLTGVSPDQAQRTAAALCNRAADSLLAEARQERTSRERRKRLDEARDVLERLEAGPLRWGRLHEAAGEWDKAIEAYTKADAGEDRLRVLRNTADWKAAVKHASGEARKDLTWLLKLERLVDERPERQNRRLRKAERRRLSQLLGRIQRKRDEDEAQPDP